LVRAYYGLGDRERLGSGSGPHDHPVRHALLRASVAGPDPLGLAFLGRPFVAIGRGMGSTQSLGKGPLLGPSLSSFRPNSRELVGGGGMLPERPSIGGVRLLRLGSRHSPRGHHGTSLSAGMVASRHIPSADVLCRWLMTYRVPCPVEELWHALPRRPSSSGRWDIGPHGADLAEEEPWHLACMDLGH
jgi:hypothetical protein